MDCSSVRKLSKANSIGQHWRHAITLESRKCPGSSFPLFHLYCLSEGGVLLYWDRVSPSSPGWPPIYNSLPPPGKRDLQVCASTFRFLSYFCRNIKKDALGHLCLWEGSVTLQKIQQKKKSEWREPGGEAAMSGLPAATWRLLAFHMRPLEPGTWRMPAVLATKEAGGTEKDRTYATHWGQDHSQDTKTLYHFTQQQPQRMFQSKL